MDPECPKSEPLLACQRAEHISEEFGSTLHDITAKYWAKYEHLDAPDILAEDGVCIAHDSGLSDIDELLYPLQYFTAGLSFTFILANIYMIFRSDLTLVVGEGMPGPPKFLMSRWIAKHLFGDSEGVFFGEHFDKFVPLVELLYLTFLLVRLVYTVVLVVYGNLIPEVFGGVKHAKHAEMTRWIRVSDIFWNYVPQLTCFSALRLLYYVTPSVLATQFYVVVFLTSQHMKLAQNNHERLKAVEPLVCYIILCIFAFIVGLDAFIVKYRMAAAFLDRQEMDLHTLFGTLIFLIQVLGVVNLNWFVRERLFIFIFGGEDGNLDREEVARLAVWNALLTKHIYRNFGVVQGSVVMMGFDDYDFQSLVLDDDMKMQKMLKKGKTCSFIEASPAAGIRSTPFDLLRSYGDQGATRARECGPACMERGIAEPVEKQLARSDLRVMNSPLREPVKKQHAWCDSRVMNSPRHELVKEQFTWQSPSGKHQVVTGNNKSSRGQTKDTSISCQRRLVPSHPSSRSAPLRSLVDELEDLTNKLSSLSQK